MKHAMMISLALGAVTACVSVPASPPSAGPVFSPPARTWPVAPTATRPEESGAGSLWTTAPNSLLSMRRAKDVGDLLTVVVEMDDKASLQSSLSRSRDSSEDLNIEALLGLPEWANGVLPGGASLSPGVDFNRNSDLNGSGAVNRAEKITFRLAARVVGVEPNGNLVIEGYQQTQVSSEVRYLTVSGVIRAQDITRLNTVSYEAIADAQLSYLSSGEATDPIQRRLAPKVLDTVLPF